MPMNLQLAAAPLLHAVAPKAVAGAGGSHATVAVAVASDTVDFATLLTQSLPLGSGLPALDEAMAATTVKEDKAAAADPLSADPLPANPAIAGDPAACLAAVQPAPPVIDAASTAADQTAFGAAEQLHAALSATNAGALRLPAVPETDEASAPATAQGNAPQLSAAAPPPAGHFAAAPVSAHESAGAALAHAAPNGAENTAPQPDRGLPPPAVPAPANAATAAPLRLEIATPLAAAGWDQQLGQRVIWMSSQHAQMAELRINPPDLGPLEMRLTLDQGGQQASLQFSSPHAEVRQTIENAMPRLREMLADAGIALGNATVSGESLPQQTTPEQNRAAARTPAQAPPRQSASGETARAAAHGGNGLVDTFA